MIPIPQRFALLFTIQDPENLKGPLIHLGVETIDTSTNVAHYVGNGGHIYGLQYPAPGGTVSAGPTYDVVVHNDDSV